MKTVMPVGLHNILLLAIAFMLCALITFITFVVFFLGKLLANMVITFIWEVYLYLYVFKTELISIIHIKWLVTLHS